MPDTMPVDKSFDDSAAADLRKYLDDDAGGDDDTPIDDGDDEEPQDDEEPDVDDDTVEDDEASDKEADKADEEPKYTVKIDGKETAVPVSELVAGYQKGADYTKKTQELSEQRKALDENVTKYSQRLEALEGLLNKPLYDDAQLSKILSEDGSEAFLQAQLENTQRANALKQVQEERDRVQKEQQEKQQQAYAAYKEEQAALLKQKNPELLTEEGAKRLATYLKSTGFTHEEVSAAADARVFILAEKARLYDALKAKKVEADKANPPKVVKSGARQPTGNERRTEQGRKAFGKLQKSGNINDAAAAIRMLNIT